MTFDKCSAPSSGCPTHARTKSSLDYLIVMGCTSRLARDTDLQPDRVGVLDLVARERTTAVLTAERLDVHRLKAVDALGAQGLASSVLALCERSSLDDRH